MLDVIMEGNDGVMEEYGPSLGEDLINQTFPFSVVVPAALEARNKLPADKGTTSVHRKRFCSKMQNKSHPCLIDGRSPELFQKVFQK